MSRIPVFFLACQVLLASQTDTIRTYRSEDDFRRGITITERQIGGKPYLEVRYNPQAKVLSKSSYKTRGNLIQFETFEYDSLTGDLATKAVFDGDRTRLETYLFDPGEPISGKFIRYVYGVKKVKELHDRFTAIKFEQGDRPKVYRFFDVNGFLYGVIKLGYDDKARLRQEDWGKMPGNRLVRRLLYGYDDESRIRDIWEYDSSRALVKHLPIDEQGRAPLFTVTFPGDSSFTNQPVISYSLLENLTEGQIVWEWAGGKADPASPHLVALAEEEMQSGHYQRFLHRVAPNLVDSAAYSLRLTAMGESGYPARDVEIGHVTYDETPPDYAVDVSPAVNRPELSFTLFESLERAELLWVWERGAKDPRSPHLVELSGEEVKKGRYDTVSLRDRVDLNDGTVYTLWFQGTDLAGNAGPAIPVSGIRFDTEKPKFSWVKPAGGQFVNAPILSYKLSEELATAELFWRWRGGTHDPRPVHQVSLMGSELKAGKHVYVLPRNAPQLVDGSVYDMVVRGADLAGNMADSLVVDGITYDRTRPVLTAFLPRPGMLTNRPEFVTSHSEDLASAAVNWQKTAGDSAVGKPAVAAVDSMFLTMGDHRFEVGKIQPLITEGASYTVTLTARDLAANEALPVVIRNVSYDFTPPLISGLQPGDSSFVSSRMISYVLSEPLRDGVVVWTQVGGEADPGSPHLANLTAGELTAGNHDSTALSESPILKDGSIYDLSFTGTDLAGNVSESAVSRQIVYDSTPPEIELVYPGTGSHVSSVQVSYRLSELFREATVTWDWVGGNPDNQAPHEAKLIGNELESGEHRLVTLKNSPELVDGAVYTLVARGKDLGLKPALPIEVAAVTFDFSSPTLLINSPSDGTPVNSSNINYALSEPLSQGTIIWTQTGGRDDPFSPHTVVLEEEELTAGEHGKVPLANSPFLMDSSIYDFMFYGTDLAQNRSDTLLVGNILFDKTSPSLEVTYPVAYTPVRSTEVEYALSEELLEASVVWIHTGGTSDQAGRHAVHLSGDELAPGEHSRSVPTSTPPGLVERGVYSLMIEGRDRAGNDARSIQIPGVIFDGTAPRFSEVSPSSGSRVNSPQVSYTLSEPLESGSVNWIRSGGREDPRSPHTASLRADELSAGRHERTVLTESPSLQDSSLYTLSFLGRDAAQNVSDTVTITQVLYDNTPPRFEIAFPSSGVTVRSRQVSYRLSETLGNSSFTWTRVGGTEDPGSPHVQSLSGDELLVGWHRDTELTESPELLEGSVYEIMFSGADPAGNLADPVTVAGVAFDATAPVIANVFPDSGAFVNHTQVSYSLTEFLDSGTVTWIHTGGREDANSPHAVSLRGEELAPGPHPMKTLMERPALVDSAVYRIQFAGEDAAGNVSDTVTVDGITYDVSRPQLVVAFPKSNSVIPSANLSYESSEELVEGVVTWTRTGGSDDPLSPHTVVLEGNPPPLQDGAVYTVTIKGSDRAGNELSPNVIQGVKYDAAPPVIARVSPADSAYVNHSRVSYHLSEDLAEGFVTWHRIEGREDSQSPYAVALTGGELKEGIHDGTLLTGGPTLVDGSIYDFSFTGKDLAGNSADTIWVTRVTHDTTSPQIEISHPEPDGFISDPRLAYHVSENLMEGQVTWTWSGGKPDPAAPHVQRMEASERQAGEHRDAPAAPVILVDGAVYTVTVAGSDSSGNLARPPEISGVTYDAFPPEIAVVSPGSDTHIKSPEVSYAMNEDFQWAEVVWTRSEGSPDPNSPHKIMLAGEQLAEGDHRNVVLDLEHPLQDGSIYTVWATGGDRAGNRADTVGVQNVSFDTTRPVSALRAPSPGDFFNQATVSYNLSESLREGTITWVHSSGPSDPGSPHIINLSGTELDSGLHEGRLLSDRLELVEGASYTVTLTGVDRAGNASDKVMAENVTYDTRPPVITLEAPRDSSYRNHARITYTLSETLSEGRATWTQTGGAPDDKSPHVTTLADTALEKGAHPEYSVTPSLTLSDGSVYEVEISGKDRAGNSSSSGKSVGVVYDETPPTLFIASPSADTNVNSSAVSYELDELLNEALITWSHSEGTPDPDAPHRITLAGPALTAGFHEGFVPDERTPLVSSARYDLTLQGEDRAGNAGNTVTVTGITFDNVPPSITVLKPNPSEFVSHTYLSYTLSEMLKAMEVRWTRVQGDEDPASPHIIELTDRQLASGDHLEVETRVFPDLIDGSVYDLILAGSDFAGNEATETVVTGVTFDATRPVVDISTPTASSAVNSTRISYSLSEILMSGTVRWERTGGNEDPKSPHVSPLGAHELREGTHDDHTLAEAPALVNGSMYVITLWGEDLAGNQADTVVVDSVLFDVSPPVIVANYPAPSGIANSPVVSYSLTEDLREGSITWTRTGGAQDPGSPHVPALASEELVAGDHQEIFSESRPDLVNGGIYSVTFDGWDRAGNRATGMVIESVTFDDESPTFVLRTPEEKPYLNAPRLSYELSETLAEGAVTWSWESGQIDAAAPHISSLTQEELRAGEHLKVTLTNVPELEDSAVYSITLRGTDLAGNEGEPVTLQGVLYDETPPILTVTAPVPGRYLNTPTLSYRVSESLEEATAIWTRTGRSPDPHSPHRVSLTGQELASGAHENIVLANQDSLVEGTVYTLTVTGKDPAGNVAEDVIIENLTFDSVPPRLALMEPSSNTYTNDLVLTYTLSESLAMGQMLLVHTGGNEDPSSPYEIELTGDDLFEGRHDEVFPPQLPDLMSGATYTVTLGGRDLAGNEAEPVRVPGVTFDNTPPVLTVSFPQSSDYVNHTRLTYELSEPLASATVTWVAQDGGPAQSKSMTETERQGGLHQEISLQDIPQLVDGKVYDIVFGGSDLANNEADPVTVMGVTYDFTPPRLKVELDSETAGTFKKDTPVSITNSEVMSEIIFVWAGESGVNDPNSPHRLRVENAYLSEGTHDQMSLSGTEGLQEGTTYTLAVTGKDLAGNESRPLSVENIDLIRDLKGDWLWKGALLTAVWSFSEAGQFGQGVMMGTRIQENELGKYEVDFTTRPYELRMRLEDGTRRYALFEFTGSNTMRVVFSQKKPTSWSDGDLMNFEFRAPQVP